MIESYVFDSGTKGKNILVFGAIHGNEICGPIAINEIIEKINNNQIKLLTGKITFIPICNQKAYEKNTRQIDVNLNRVFCYHSIPSNYEENLANELINYVLENDILIDLHSTHTDDKPFVFQDYLDCENEKLAKIVGVENIVKGWPEIYCETTSSDTVGFAHSKGKIGVVVECGNHNDEKSVEIAKNAILNAMKYYGLIKGEISYSKTLNEVVVNEFVIKKKNGSLVKNFNHLDIVKAGEIIAKYDDKEELLSPYDGYILLPFPDAKIGDEWFYLGK